MSRSISPAWLRGYLLGIAETHGGDLMSVPVHTAAKKVQIVKFLTRQVEGQDNWIWAVVSDLQYTLPVRFSKEAMAAYKQNPMYGHNSISSYKTALISMKNFRPMFARIPKPDGDGMSVQEHLALEVRAFTLNGSFDASVWGAPKDIQSEKDIKEWVHGMREGSGGGNVLKLRKQEQAEASAGSSRSSPPLFTQVVSHATQQRSSSPDGNPALQPPRPAQRPNKLRGGPLKAHERRWRSAKEPPDAAEIGAEMTKVGHVYGSPSPGPSSPPASKSKDGFAIPRTPPRRRSTRYALDLGSSPERPRTPPSQLNQGADAGQRTPSAWSPSVDGGSPRHSLDEDSDHDANADADAPGSDADAPGDADDAMNVDATRADDPASDPHEDAFGEPLSSRSASPAASPPLPLPPHTPLPTSSAPAPLTEGPPTEGSPTKDRSAQLGGLQSSALSSGLAGSSLPPPTPAQRPRPASPPLPTPGRVRVPDSTQAREREEPSQLPPSSVPSASDPDASQSEVHAAQPEPAPTPNQHESKNEPSQDDSQPGRASKLVHSSQPWTSPAITSTQLPPPPPPAVTRAPPPNRAFSGTLALDAPWGVSTGVGRGRGVEMSQGRVLVPDSDVSATTASQSQCQSQDHVQNQAVSGGEQSGEAEKEGAAPDERAQEVEESQTQPESQVPASPQTQERPLAEQQAQQPTSDHSQALQEEPEPAAQPQTQDESQGSKSGQSLSYATDSQEVPAASAQPEHEGASGSSQLPAIPEAEAVRADGGEEEDVPHIGDDAQPKNEATGPLEAEAEPEAPRPGDASQEVDEEPQVPGADDATTKEDASLDTQDNDTADEAQAEDALVGSPSSSQSEDVMDVDVSAEVPVESDMEIVQGSVMDEQILELPEDAQDSDAQHAPDEDENMDSDDERMDKEVRAALAAESQVAPLVQTVVHEEVEVAEVVEERVPAATAPPDVEEPSSDANTSFPKRLFDTFKRMLPGGGVTASPRGSSASEALKEVSDKTHDIPVSDAQPGASGSKPTPADVPQTPEKTYHDAEAWKAPSFMRKHSAEAVLKSGPPRTPEPVKARSPVSSPAPKPPLPKPVPTQSTSRLAPPPNSPAKPPAHRKSLAASSISTPSRTQDTSYGSRAISGTTLQSNSTLPTSVATDASSTNSMKPRRVLKRRLPEPATPERAKKRRIAPTEVIEIPSSPEMDKRDLPPPRKKIIRKVPPAPPREVADEGKAREVGRGKEEGMVEKGNEKGQGMSSLPQKPVQRVYASRGNDPRPREEPASIAPVKATALNNLSSKARGKQPLREAPSDEPAEDPRATPPPGKPVVPRSPRKSYPVQRRKVGGMKLDLDLKKLDEPPEHLVSWRRFRKMMHAHGHAQFKAKQAKEGAGRKQQVNETGKGKGKQVDRKK